MNRDERRSRSQGLPPFVWPNTDLLAPQDPDAGGTWIGVRPDGTWACLLNGYLDYAGKTIDQPMTRGRLIPLILGGRDPLSTLHTEDLHKTHAFRLWIGSSEGVQDIFWDGETLKARPASFLDRFAFVTSSSVDQQNVKEKRAQVFEDWVDDGAKHQENGLPTLLTGAGGLNASDAIAMTREHSHSKSCTQITVIHDAIRMQHWAFEERMGEPPTALSLEIRD